MKPGWKTVKLGEVARFDKFQGYHSGLPYVGLEHIESGTRKFLGSRSDAEVQSATFMFNPEHVLYGRLRPYLRKVLVPDFAGHCSTEIFPILPSKDLDRSFLSYWLISDATTAEIDSLCNGARMPRANMEKALGLEIPLPPLAEQKRIVALLDEAFAGIDKAKANAESNFENAQAVFESHLQSLFGNDNPGWVQGKLSSLTTKIGSGATPRGGEESYKTEGVSLIRSLNVHDLGFKYAKLAFLDETQAAELSGVTVQENDVLLNITGASVARCAIVPRDALPARVNQHVAIIRTVPEKLYPAFLHYLLISKPYKSRLLETGEEGGSTRQAITKAQLQEFTISHPVSTGVQRLAAVHIDEVLDQIRRLSELHQKRLDAFSILKQSLLTQAFSGVLTT